MRKIGANCLIAREARISIRAGTAEPSRFQWIDRPTPSPSGWRFLGAQVAGLALRRSVGRSAPALTTLETIHYRGSRFFQARHLGRDVVGLTHWDAERELEFMGRGAQPATLRCAVHATRVCSAQAQGARPCSSVERMRSTQGRIVMARRRSLILIAFLEASG